MSNLELWQATARNLGCEHLTEHCESGSEVKSALWAGFAENLTGEVEYPESEAEELLVEEFENIKRLYA